MTKKGARKTTNSGATGFLNGVQLLAQTRNRLPEFHSRPYHEFTEVYFTATLISLSHSTIEEQDGSTFFTSLLNTIGGLNTSTPEILRHDIGGFAMTNPGQPLAHEFTMFDFLQLQLGVNLTLDEYTEWWRSQLREQPRALIPFLMAAASLLSTQIVIWTQGQRNSLTTTHLFSPPNFRRQFHFIADRHISMDPCARMDGIADYHYTMEHQRGWLYYLGTPPWDSRLAGRDLSHVTEIPDILAQEVEAITTSAAVNGDTPPTTGVETAAARTMRSRCTSENCYLTTSQGQTQCLVCIRSEATRVRLPPELSPPQEATSTYGESWTDGSCLDVPAKQAYKVGGWAYRLLCGKGIRIDASCSLGPNSSNNIAEFTAISQLVQQAIEQGLKILRIHTDSMLVVQYFEGTCLRTDDCLITLWQDTSTRATSNGLHLRFKHVYAHQTAALQDLNNAAVDSMAKEAARACDELRRTSTSRIAEFAAPFDIVPPRVHPNAGANYQTFAPYAALNPNVTVPRTRADLTTDAGDVLYICPLCDHTLPATLMRDRRALLAHIRSTHRPAPEIAEDLQHLFSIRQCTSCRDYFSTLGKHNHHCTRQPRGLPQAIAATPNPPRAPALLTLNELPLMTSPEDISDELIEHLTGISYEDIFRHRARTIVELHHSSVTMWASALSLMMRGVIKYAFDAPQDPENTLKADAFRKLLLMLPRLLLSDSKGVAKRARMLLSGKLPQFQELIRISSGTARSPRQSQAPLTQTRMQKRINSRVSTLVRSCDLSRAINSLSPPEDLPVSQEELIQRITDLHPIAPQEHQIPTSAQIHTFLDPQHKLFDLNLLLRVIKDLRTHAAPDMTGYRAGHFKCIFRGRREQDSPEMQCRSALNNLIHNIMISPNRLGPDPFWEYFAGGKLSILVQNGKIRPIGQKNLLLKIITAIQGRLFDKDLHRIAGPAHLAGRRDGVLAVAVMTQMELDYSQCNPDKERCILVTDAKAAFQSASRRHCHAILQADDTLRVHLAPFFAKQHQGMHKIVWSEGNRAFPVSSGFTQGDINASKLFACNTANLVAGLQHAALQGSSLEDNATVMAIIDDITIMGDLEAICRTEAIRSALQLPPNYVVNPLKQNVYTINEHHVELLEHRLPHHKVTYIGRDMGFTLSGVPQGGQQYIELQLEKNLTATLKIINDVLKLEQVQDQLLLLLYCIPGRIQHLLAAIPTNISRPFARRHDEALRNAVAQVLQLGQLTQRDILQMQRKISNHGMGLRSMENNLEFLFLSGFARSIKTIQNSFPHSSEVVDFTLFADQGYGRLLQDALDHVRDSLGNSRDLLPEALQGLVHADFTWDHAKLQRELDNVVQRQHEALYDLNRVSDQQAKAAYMAIDASIFMLIPRHKTFVIPNEHLRYLARQLLGKPQRAYMRRYCSNVSQAGNICYTPLDMHDIHVSICRTSATRHIKHAELQEWFTDLAKQARIPVTSPEQVTTPGVTERGRADICLVGISLRSDERDGISGVIDVSVVQPAAPSYCANSAKQFRHATRLKETIKNNRYKNAYQQLDNSNFIPFVIENGGTFGEQAEKAFSTICNLIARETGQSVSSIAHFWKSTLLVILARRAYDNAQHWTRAHHTRFGPHTEDLATTGCYDIDTAEQRTMIHSAGLPPVISASPEYETQNAEILE